MAFHGDLSSYPLPELLQWLDSSRKTGALQLVWEGGERKLFVLAGQVVATASRGLWERLSRALHQGNLVDGQALMAALRESDRLEGPADLGPEVRGWVRELAAIELFSALADLTHAAGGRFHWSEDPDRGGDEWVALEVPLRHALFESLRYLDEQPDVDRVLAVDTLMVEARAPAQAGLPVLQRVLLTLTATPPGVNLGKLRLLLGLHRSVVVRAVYELLRARRASVDGVGPLLEDPVADMLESGAVLLRERQFEAAGLVFAALLQSDPADRRVREFARMVEREHAASLYRELPPTAVLRAGSDPAALARLRPEERQLAALVNGKWDVSTLVLASPLRELDTLQALHKLRRLDLVEPLEDEAG